MLCAHAFVSTGHVVMSTCYGIISPFQILLEKKRKRNMRRILYLHVVLIEPDQGGLSLNCQFILEILSGTGS